MKANFQETIKQKTDKELETISKDYAFYSEKERLIALNELEFRNSLTKELLTRKENIESTIEILTITEQVAEAVKSKKRIYKENAIWAGTMLGGPLVAGYLIAENFKTFGEISEARKTWVYSILATIIIFSGAFLIPDDLEIPNLSIPLLCTAIAYLFVKYFQGKNISAFIASGGKPFGWGRTIVVSVIGLVITFVLLLFVLFFIMKEE